MAEHELPGLNIHVEGESAETIRLESQLRGVSTTDFMRRAVAMHVMLDNLEALTRAQYPDEPDLILRLAMVATNEEGSRVFVTKFNKDDPGFFTIEELEK